MQTTHHAFYSSPIGLIRIGCNETCITEVNFIDKDNVRTEEVDKNPSLLLQQCLEELIEYFQGHRRKFEVPVHQNGTDFQERVWNELLNIPFGKTISYLTLSKRLGDPKAIRAAASTNGKNNIAIIVPCHRVIGSNNDLVGYAGGLWRKKFLLELESKVMWGVQTLF